MILFLKGRIVFIRTFAFDGGPIARANHRIPIEPDADSTLLEQSESSFESFCTMVKNTIHAFRSQSNRVIRPEKIYFSGIGALYPDAPDLLNRFLALPAEQVDLSKDKRVDIDEHSARSWNPALMNDALALAFREEKRQLNSGDKLLLYTDGVFEYQNHRGEFYGNEQFHRQLIDLNDRPISNLVDLQFQALMKFGNAAAPKDDISLLGIEFR